MGAIIKERESFVEKQANKTFKFYLSYYSFSELKEMYQYFKGEFDDLCKEVAMSTIRLRAINQFKQYLTD